MVCHSLLSSHLFTSYNWSSTGVPAVPVVPYHEADPLELWGPQHQSEPCTVESDEIGVSCRTMATYPQGLSELLRT